MIDCLPIARHGFTRQRLFFISYLAEKHRQADFHGENVIFSYTLVMSRAEMSNRNEYWHHLYKRLRKEGYRNLRDIPAKNLTGKDNEGSVDGAHQTDLGFLRMAKTFLRYLKK